MNKFHTWLVISVFATVGASSPHAAQVTSLRFDQPVYYLAQGQRLNFQAMVSQSPPGGLFSYGFEVGVQGSNSLPPNLVTLGVPAALNFAGVFSNGALITVQSNVTSARGTVDVFAKKASYSQTMLATGYLAALSVGEYALQPRLNRPLGDSEAAFVSGKGVVIDSALALTPSTILVQSSLQFASGLSSNASSGLFEQTLQIRNTTAATVSKVRVLVHHLPAGSRLENEAGTDAGVPYVDFDQSLSPNSTVLATVQFSVPNTSSQPDPQYEVRFSDATALVAVKASARSASRDLVVTRAYLSPDHGFVLEFPTELNRTYTIQFSEDLAHWSSVSTVVSGSGNIERWTDPSGIPSNNGLSVERRFYRILSY